MSESFVLDEVAEIASRTGLSQKEIIEIMKLVGPNPSSVMREATILKQEMSRFAGALQRETP